MPIIDLQRRLTEAGRIRLGDKGPKGAPRKLETFRLTSSDRLLLDRVAALYGGQVSRWDAMPGQYEITTEATTLDVIVPPSSMAFSQWLEMWSGGGCVKRCDGIWNTVADAPCSCDPEKRDCKPHTRLSVILRDLPSIGVWRLDTQGFYAATELLGAVELIQTIGNAGTMLPARLRLETRTVKRPGEGTKRFVVPILDVAQTLPELMATTGNIPGMPALASGGMTPVPIDELPAAPVATIAEQTAARRVRPARANAAQPIPSTGIIPRPQHMIDAPPDSLPVGSVGDNGGESDGACHAQDSPPSPDDDATTRARQVARLMRECVTPEWPDGITGDNRPLFLDAYSLGRYRSAKEIPPSEFEDVKETIRGVKQGFILFDALRVDGAGMPAPVLRVALTGLIHTPHGAVGPANDGHDESPFV